MTTPSDPAQRATDSSTADLMQARLRDLRQLLREELGSAVDEVTATARRARPADVLLGGAAACGLVAGGTSAVVVLRTLDRFLPPVAASVAATGMWTAAAVAMARAGVAELRQAGPLLPRQTADNLRADAAALRTAVTGS